MHHYSQNLWHNQANHAFTGGHMKHTIIAIIVVLLLSACAAPTPAPTATPVPPTSTPASTEYALTEYQTPEESTRVPINLITSEQTLYIENATDQYKGPDVNGSDFLISQDIEITLDITVGRLGGENDNSSTGILFCGYSSNGIAQTLNLTYQDGYWSVGYKNRWEATDFEFWSSFDSLRSPHQIFTIKFIDNGRKIEISNEESFKEELTLPQSNNTFFEGTEIVIARWQIGPFNSLTVKDFTGYGLLSEALSPQSSEEYPNEFSQLVEHYVDAYGGLVIVDERQMDATQLTQELLENTNIYSRVINVDGIDHTLLVVNDIPLAYMDNNGIWQEPTLKTMGDLVGLEIGTLLSPQYIDTTTFWRNEYHIGAICIDNGSLPKVNEEVDWDWNNTQLEIAAINDLKTTRLQAVLFGLDRPRWIDLNVTQDDLDYLVRLVVDYAKENQIDEIVVTNESTPYIDQWRNDFYWDHFGIDYIINAFTLAKELYPEAKLIFNDTGNHKSANMNTKTTKMIVNRLYEDGLIDYVGVEMHVDQDFNMPNKQDLIAVFNSYPVPVVITEFDANLNYVEGDAADREMDRITKIVFDGCLESEHCLSITTWGEKEPGWEGRTLLRDEQNKRKSAYYVAMQSMFLHLDVP